MFNRIQKKIHFFLVGFAVGVLIAMTGTLYSKKIIRELKVLVRHGFRIKISSPVNFGKYKQVEEDFKKPFAVVNAETFGKYKQLTFELYRRGTFVIDGKSGYAWQKSDSYWDSAFIRSTQPLPKTYKISVVIGDIDYGLEKIEGLALDPDYPEGPQNENGCYLLAITDEVPVGHHTNIWWHQHRKAVIDVDNNVWGHGMPNPIFMVYFDTDDNLVAFDGEKDSWQNQWAKAVTYSPKSWYRIEVEKTKYSFILSIYNDKEELLKRGSVDLKNIWHENDNTQDYFVIGDPHENYYQGSMKIRSISMPVKVK